MKNPYGIAADGALVTVDAVERGLACNCHCPACGQRLQAHHGASRRAYFSHYRGADCGLGYETALHMLAKEVIAAEGRLLLPELVAESDRSIAAVGSFLETRVLVPPWRRQRFDVVTLEKSERTFRPDLTLAVGGRRLFVEIHVTHRVDREKLSKIESRGVGTIEFDFSRTRRSLTSDDLKRVLVDTYAAKGRGRGTWVYHPELRSTQAELTARYRDRNALLLRGRAAPVSGACNAYARAKGR